MPTEEEIIQEVLKFDPGRKQQAQDEDAIIQEILKFDPGKIGGTYQPKPSPFPGGTSPISTITGEVEKQYVGAEEPFASMGTLAKTTFVDDPKKQIEIYAEARGISPSQYKVHNGEIIFRNKEGKWQRETGELPLSMLKKGAVQTAVNPAVIMGTAGAFTGNPLIAGTLAAGGEGIRKSIGAALYGEKQSSLGNALDMTLQGVLAGGSEIVGKLGAAGLRKIMLGSKTTQYAGKEVVEGLLTPADHAKAQMVQGIARANNIDLAPHQLYNKEGMTNIWMYLRKHPQTADAIRAFEDTLENQTDEATRKFVQIMGGYDEPPFMIGKKLQEVASKSIESAKEVRRIASSPYYQRAFKSNADVDIKPVIDYIDTELATAKGEIRTQLLRAKNILSKPDLPKVTPAEKPMLFDASGKPMGGAPKVEEWDTSLEGLHGSKIEFDRIIENAKQDSLGNTVKRQYANIRELLLNQMDSASPDYKAAREHFARLSKPVDALKKSIVGYFEGLEKDVPIDKSYHKLLDLTDAELVKRARQSLEPQDPELWNRIIGSYIRDTYQGLKMAQTEGKVINPAGKMHQALFGTEEKRQVMKAAMTADQYEAFSDLMLVFQRASVGTARQSMTAPYLQIEKQIAGPLLSTTQGNIAKTMKHPWDSAVDMLFETWGDIRLAGRQQALLNSLTSPNSLEQIRKLKPLSPGSRKLIEGVSAYVGMLLPKVGLEDIGNRLPEERGQSQIGGRR